MNTEGRRRFRCATLRWAVAAIVLACIARVESLLPSPAPDRPQKCTYHKAYGMNGAYCSKLDLYYVPTTLKTNIEILDLSSNRIRELRDSTFVDYTRIRFLYLSDNMIQRIEPHTFEPLSSLEVLDMSLNALTTIPEFVLNMPALRKLYFVDNSLRDLNRDLETMSKPFAAPLQYVNIANCELTKFPDFGVMPELANLNVSLNPLRDLRVRDFTNLCALKTLDLNGSFPSEPCASKRLAMWFISKKIITIPETFSIYDPSNEEIKRCRELDLDEEEISTYAECQSRIQVKEETKAIKKTWLIVGGSLGGFLILSVCLLYCVHRRNVRQAKILSEKDENSHKFINDEKC